ncbi:MAG: o-succinylbenzoate--CoA ligase [Burkholderiales bacterium]|nr:o-succinylbenzoate--CoA ligase [Burkholderiales bacterium]
MTGGAPAIVSGLQSVSYEALRMRVRNATGKLRALGVAEGARVGLWAGNAIEWIVIALAVPRAGAVLVPLNTRLADAEIRWQAARAGLRLVIADDALAAREIGARRLVSFAEWRALAPGDGEPVAGHDDPARDAAILFTSGTTGRPKGAVLARGNQLASARASGAVLPLAPGDRWIASLPFFHVGGLGIVHRCLLAGACVAMPDDFSAEALDRAIEDHGVTHLSVVDATLRRILEARGGRPLPGRVRAVVVGGGPVSPALLEACPQAMASYGLTESCAMATLVRPGASDAQRRTAGQALPGVELRIAADGVIELRGPMVMRGYLDDPEATAASLRDGWLRTGDLGELDADGCLRVLSRRDDLIISGGENVYPAEIEHALREHPAVADAVVVGVPDDQWGEVPLAFVELRAPGEPDLRAFLAPRLARYKIPRIAFVDAIPRLANGKPDRATLKSRPP